jgi:two-component system OmpR family response regulator
MSGSHRCAANFSPYTFVRERIGWWVFTGAGIGVAKVVTSMAPTDPPPSQFVKREIGSGCNCYRRLTFRTSIRDHCMRILIVEDEKRVADFLDRGLRAEGHFCVIASDGEQGLKLASEGQFDLILLDLLLPRMHGHEVCQRLRMNKINTPLMILTAMDSVDDVITGLRLGADEYMTKPFAFEELLARIELVKRRSSTKAEEDPCLRGGSIVFDRNSLRVTVNNEEVHMTTKELAILELLMSKPGMLFSRERILSSVWGLDMDPMSNVVDVYIGRLRKLIDRDGDESLIETIRGRGFRLNLPPGRL